MKITVYCGKSIEGKCGKQLHPTNEVQQAYDFIKSLSLGEHQHHFSNNPDFVSAIKWIGEKYGVKTEFYLDDVYHGSNIDPIFADFNQSMTLIHKYATKDKE